jgi:timeless
MTVREIKSTVTILHRIAFEYKNYAMLFQAQLFRVFQQVFHAPKEPRYEELRKLGTYIIRQFVRVVPNNPKIFPELLFFHSVRDAREMEYGYTDSYDTASKKGTWTEEEDEELRRLFMENQENPQTDQDVIDWIMDNLIDKTRTRRGIIKKLKELGLIFRAPTKKSTAAAANKNLFKPEEDQQLRELYDQFRMDRYALRRIMEMLNVKRRKSKVIERMITLGLIADASEILPVKKPRKNAAGAPMEGPFEGQSDGEETASESEDDSDVENTEPTYNATHSNQMSKKSKSSAGKQMMRKKVKKSSVNVKTVNTLRNEIEESYKEALEWIIESINEAADDFEEVSDDPDDGIPIVPIMDFQTEAMQNEQFRKLLLAVGIQAPEKTVSFF